MKKIIYLCIVVFITACGGTSEEAIETIAMDVDVLTFKSMIEVNDNEIIIDVRTPAETEKGMIVGAININIGSDTFKEEVGKLDKNQPIFVYCHAGGRSSKAMGILKGMGFTEVYSLLGGYSGWE